METGYISAPGSGLGQAAALSEGQASSQYLQRVPLSPGLQKSFLSQTEIVSRCGSHHSIWVPRVKLKRGIVEDSSHTFPEPPLVQANRPLSLWPFLRGHGLHSPHRPITPPCIRLPPRAGDPLGCTGKSLHHPRSGKQRTGCPGWSPKGALAFCSRNRHDALALVPVAVFIPRETWERSNANAHLRAPESAVGIICK